MKRGIILGLLLAVSVLSACGSGEETRTVEWYLRPENKAVWEAKLAECKNNPGELGKTPNCINARKAFEQNFLRGDFKPMKDPTYGFDKE